MVFATVQSSGCVTAFLRSSAQLWVSHLLLLVTPCLEAREFLPLRFLREQKREVRKNNCSPRAFATWSKKKLSSDGCPIHLTASANPRLPTLPTCSSRGLVSRPAQSSRRAGRTVLNETPFCIGGECFPGAAFVAAAESPLSGRCWKPAHRLPGEQPPRREVADVQQLFGGGGSSTGGIFELKETKDQAGEGVGVEILSSGGFIWKRTRRDCGGAAWRSRCFADGTDISMGLLLWRLQPKFKAAQLPDYGRRVIHFELSAVENNMQTLCA